MKDDPPFRKLSSILGREDDLAQECDLCGRRGEEAELVPARHMQYATDPEGVGGFDPFELGLFSRSGAIHLGSRTTMPVLELEGATELSDTAFTTWSEQVLPKDHSDWNLCPACMSEFRPCIEAYWDPLGEVDDADLPLAEVAKLYLFDVRTPFKEAASKLEWISGMLSWVNSHEWRQRDLRSMQETDWVHAHARAQHEQSIADSSIDGRALFERLLEPFELYIEAQKIYARLSMSCAECRREFRIFNLNVLHRLVQGDIEVRSGLQSLLASYWGSYPQLPFSVLGYDDWDFFLKILDPSHREGPHLECEVLFDQAVLSAGGKASRLDSIDRCPLCDANDVRIRVERDQEDPEIGKAAVGGLLPLVSIPAGLALIAAIVWLTPAGVDYRVKLAGCAAIALGTWWFMSSWFKRENLTGWTRRGDYSFVTEGS